MEQQKPTNTEKLVLEAKFLGELKSLISQHMEKNPSDKVSSPLFINGVWRVEVES